MIPHGRSAAYLAVMMSLLIKECWTQCQDNKPVRLHASSVMADRIYSPRYPENYPNYADCAWHITADRNYVIRLRVNWIDLEDFASCYYDNITLYDGRSTYYPTVASFCTDKEARDYYSTGNNMYVWFRSDFNNNFKGFLLTYSAVYVRAVPTTTKWYTARPDTTTAPTTYDWQAAHINTSALIGGITAGLLLLVIVCALCRYYYGRVYAARHAPRPFYPTHHAPPTRHAPPSLSAPSASTVYQNNNAVFMVSTGANTNYAFSPCGDAPPAYFAAAAGAAGRPVMGAGAFPAPPSYNEAMLLSHPPAVAPSYAPVVTAQDLSSGGTTVPPPAQPPPVPARPAPPPPPRGLAPPTYTPRGQAPPPLGPNPNPSAVSSVSSPHGPLSTLSGAAPC